MGKWKYTIGMLGVLFIVSLIASCATVPELRVEYRVPEKSDVLKGKKIFLDFEDARANKEILREGAKTEFEGFSGTIALSLAYGAEKGFRVGLYDVRALFLEIFNKRLANLGMTVVVKQQSDQAHMVIVLKEFTLDLENRKWIARMSYEARSLRDNQVLRKETISGQVDQMKIMGRTQAYKVMGEILTDLVNRLDVVKLLQLDEA
jgi:hypothetical protein